MKPKPSIAIIAFLPRHGRKHEYLPSEVPYRANLWALRELGVRQIIAFNELAREALADGVGTVHPTGTVVVIQGPRFSTRAESAWFTSQGWHLVNMTQYPEVVLARELELCYMNLSYITDYDVAAREIVMSEEAEVVSHQEVVRQFNLEATRVQEAVTRMISAFPEEADCSCRHAMEGAWV